MLMLCKELQDSLHTCSERPVSALLPRFRTVMSHCILRPHAPQGKTCGQHHVTLKETWLQIHQQIVTVTYPIEEAYANLAGMVNRQDNKQQMFEPESDTDNKCT